jgi:uncharacterized membrane protein
MSTAIAIHLAAAALALPLGAWVLRAPKGTPVHRTLGRVWVALMAITALSSLWIPGFLKIGWIHVFTLIVGIGVPLAILAIRRGNVAAHRRAMISSFIGLAGAALGTLIPGRIVGNTVLRAIGLQ